MKIAAIAALVAAAGSANAVLSTSFETAPTNPQTTSNPIGTSLDFAGSATEAGFTVTWADTRSTGSGGPVDGGESGDFLGVTSFTGDVGSFTDGSQGFQFNDTDGALSLNFSFDTDALTDLELTFDVFVNGTGYESNDLFEVLVNGNSEFLEGEPELEAVGDTWRTIVLDLSAYDNTDIDVTFTVDTNSGSENIYLDQIAVTGIPTPGTVALAGIAGLAAARRRRNG